MTAVLTIEIWAWVVTWQIVKVGLANDCDEIASERRQARAGIHGSKENRNKLWRVKSVGEACEWGELDDAAGATGGCSV